MTDSLLSAAIPDVSVTVIGSGTGNGSPITDGMTVVTPDHLPNFVVRVIPTAIAILVRALNAFAISVSGLLVAGPATGLIPFTDFMHLLGTCASLSVGAVVLGALKDWITIGKKLEQKYPLATGSV